MAGEGAKGMRGGWVGEIPEKDAAVVEGGGEERAGGEEGAGGGKGERKEFAGGIIGIIGIGCCKVAKGEAAERDAGSRFEEADGGVRAARGDCAAVGAECELMHVHVGGGWEAVDKAAGAGAPNG